MFQVQLFSLIGLDISYHNTCVKAGTREVRIIRYGLPEVNVRELWSIYQTYKCRRNWTEITNSWDSELSYINFISLFCSPEHKKLVQSRDHETLTCFRRYTLHNSILNVLWHDRLKYTKYVVGYLKMLGS